MTTPQREASAQKPDVEPKKKAAEQPSRDDVHEQREPMQEREGVVRQRDAPPPKT